MLNTNIIRYTVIKHNKWYMVMQLLERKIDYRPKLHCIMITQTILMITLIIVLFILYAKKKEKHSGKLQASSKTQ
jgi:uncharacterized membrane protein YidH (DUF202 family)